MRIFVLLFLPVLCFATPVPVRIIPAPAELIAAPGVFSLNGSGFRMSVADSSFSAIAQAFSADFYRLSGIRIDQRPGGSRSIILSKDNRLPHEGYTLDIAADTIRIAAADAAGMFYAFTSLRQLLPAGQEKTLRSKRDWTLPCLHIRDWPRFGYRGMHLDVSRHFFSIDFLQTYLDLLAHYKINTFHWHLTDSHGWRLEIKKYPRLTSVGAWRASRNLPMTIAPPTQPGERADYGGFYTQEDVKKLIRYAAERYITIIPEIEMPGHCDAAVVAYPEYTCLNNPVPLLQPTGYQGDLTHNFCPGNDSTFLFLQDVLDEVMALFPARMIHIGGDEVKPASWLSCPRCQQRMRAEHLSTARDLQRYFTHRIDAYISSRGRQLIGWDEIMEAGISKNASVMSWRGNEGGIAAARAGHSVVMSPYPFVYFDFYQSAPELEPNITYAALPLEKVYCFDPLPGTLDSAEAKHILGGEACLWTENVLTPERVEYMLLPRLMALAESVWSPPPVKNYRQFIDRCEEQFTWLEAHKINYARSLYNVFIEPQFDRASRRLSAVVKDQVAGKYLIRYNLKGMVPAAGDPVYQAPVTIEQTSTLSTALFAGGKMMGKVSRSLFSVHHALGAQVRTSPAETDTAAGAELFKLADGIHGSFEPADGRWVRFDDSAISVVLQTDTPVSVRRLSFNCLEDMIGNSIAPASVKIMLSKDGRNYHAVWSLTNNKLPLKKLRHIVHYQTGPLKEHAQYIRVDFTLTQRRFTAEPSKNNLLIDEIVVD